MLALLNQSIVSGLPEAQAGAPELGWRVHFSSARSAAASDLGALASSASFSMAARSLRETVVGGSEARMPTRDKRMRTRFRSGLAQPFTIPWEMTGQRARE